MSDTAKKGILVVSFGTSHEDTRVVTIDAIEKEIGAAFTDCKVYRCMDKQDDPCQNFKERSYSL